MTNALVNKENEACMKSLRKSGKTGFVINAKDLRTDIHTGTQKVNIDENARTNNTGNLITASQVCIAATVMLIDNLNVSDRVINILIGTVTYPHGLRNNKIACGAIYGECIDSGMWRFETALQSSQ